MTNVIWTQSYEAAVNTKRFKIYASEAPGGLFSASCLYYEGDRVLRAPEDQSGGLKFDLKTISSVVSAEDALVQLTAWMEEKFGQPVSIKQV